MKFYLNTLLMNLETGKVVNDYHDDRTPVEVAMASADAKPRIIETPYTTKFVAVRALTQRHGQGEQPLSVEEHVKRFEMMRLFMNTEDDSVEVTAEQLTLLKALVAKAFPPMIAGQFAVLVEASPKE